MKPNSTLWFTAHECRLARRDLYGMLTANKPNRGRQLIFGMAVVMVLLHAMAYAALREFVDGPINADLSTLVLITGILLLPLSLITSQAMELITRAFYTRSDLELILASPAPAPRLFAVRMLAIAFSTTGLTLAISMPVINTLLWLSGPGWLWAYPIIMAFGLISTSIAIAMTLGLFKVIGPKRTRLIAQIAAAVVGAGFVIGVQLFAIASIGSISRLSFLQSDTLLQIVPPPEHWIYTPALGAMGNLASAITFIAFACALFATTIGLTARHYGAVVLKAGSIDLESGRKRAPKASFRPGGAAHTLRRKEWKLLLRDKWLISQTLMQLLYLIPPAYMLWDSFGSKGSAMAIVVPVIVMAAGQLAGGLAWLAISGEDAPELVTTAPVTPAQVLRAKVEAVLTGVAVVVAPLVFMAALVSPWSALMAVIGVTLSVASAVLIQLWFKAQAKRSNFRRRQTSSKVATFAEAFSSILWAGTAGLAVAGSWIAAIPALIALSTLAVTWRFSPAHEGHVAERALKEASAAA